MAMQTTRDTIESLPLVDRDFAWELKETKAGLPFLRALVLIDATGNILADGSAPKGDTLHIDLSDRSYFAIHQKKKTKDLFFGKPKISRRDGNWFFPVSRAIYGTDGKLRYVIMASIEPMYFFHLFQSLSKKQNQHANLIHEDGTLFIRYPFDEKRIGHSMADTDLFRKKLKENDNGFFSGESPYTGKKYFVAYQAVKNFPFVLVVGVSHKIALENFRKNLFVWTSIAALVIGFVFYSARFQIRSNKKIFYQAQVLENKTKKLETTNRILEETREKLVQQEKMAVLGEMAGGIGHELRNPLGVISNSIYYLKLLPHTEVSAVREYLEIISTEVDNAEKIVSDLLDFSKNHKLNRQVVNLNDFINHLFKKHPVKENFRIEKHIPPEINVYADPLKLEQVLFNLVINGLQAMDEGGVLTVGAVSNHKHVHISISDTGCGMDEKQQKKIFEPLFTTRAKGIGLGLSLSKNFIEAHGGRVEVKSRLGEGATFTIILPGQDVQEASDE
jgi:signal transduction histidine kinase